jgi:hypothetical protein
LLIAFMPLAQLASAANNGLLIVANTGLVLTYDILACAIAHVAFKGISRMPDQALRWISPFVMTDSAQTVPASQTSSSASTASSTITALIQKMGHYASMAGLDSKEGRSAPPANSPVAQSPLFPVYRQGGDAKFKEADKAASPAPSSSSTPIVAMPSLVDSRDKKSRDEDKKKEKKKDPSLPEIPLHAEKGEPKE